MLASLRGRLWASYALVIVAALGVAALFLLLYLLRNPLLYRQTQARLQAAAALAEVAEISGSERSLTRLKEAAALFNVRIVSFSPDRVVLLDTGASGAALPFPRFGIFNRLAKTLRDAAGRSWLYVLQKGADGTWLMVAAPRPRLSIVALFADDMLPLFAVGGLVALLLSLGVSYLLARWIAGPLELIVTAAATMPPKPVAITQDSGPREVRELGQAFNAMVGRILRAQESQRNLIADVSHELKTPLTSIQGFAQAIIDRTADTPASQLHAAEVIHNESLRMQRLVAELLDLARLESGTSQMRRDDVDLSAVLRAAAERLRPQIGESAVDLELTGVETPLHVTGDAERLLQVFSNVVENAVKHSAPGGIVHVSALSRGDSVEVDISDDGPGIAQADLPRIFDRFFQADRSRQRGGNGGAGLGLAIAREIVGAHNGRITVRSRPGQGTTMTVRLPTG